MSKITVNTSPAEQAIILKIFLLEATNNIENNCVIQENKIPIDNI